MTNKEIENRIKNLEIALSSLASKTHNRDAKAESDVSRVESDLALACKESSVSDSWDATTTYKVGDYVLYLDHLFRCLIANYGQTPTDNHYWKHTTIVSELNYLNERKVDKV